MRVDGVASEDGAVQREAGPRDEEGGGVRRMQGRRKRLQQLHFLSISLPCSISSLSAPSLASSPSASCALFLTTPLPLTAPSSSTSGLRQQLPSRARFSSCSNAPSLSTTSPGTLPPPQLLRGHCLSHHQPHLAHHLIAAERSPPLCSSHRRPPLPSHPLHPSAALHAGVRADLCFSSVVCSFFPFLLFVLLSAAADDDERALRVVGRGFAG